MFNIKKVKSKSTSIINFLIVLNAVLLNFAVSVHAKETTNQNDNSDYGLPTHRRDGGSRGNNNSCTSKPNANHLVALIPEKTVGINASSSPKLFFYVPKVKEQKTLEFVLRDEQDRLIYEAFFTTKGEGIMSVDIPEDINDSLLEKDTNYHWYLSVICNAKQRSRDIVVEGWMRQSTVDLVTKQELDKVDSIAQAELYHAQGYWFDALSVLASDRASEAEETIVKAKWSELLESVGLEELATAPFIESELIDSSSVAR